MPLSRQTLATTRPARVDNAATVFGCHARPKAVLARPAECIRLECSFHIDLFRQSSTAAPLPIKNFCCAIAKRRKTVNQQRIDIFRRLALPASHHLSGCKRFEKNCTSPATRQTPQAKLMRAQFCNHTDKINAVFMYSAQLYTLEVHYNSLSCKPCYYS